MRNYFDFGPVVKVMTFKDISILSIFISGGHFVQQSRMICAILVEGIMWNISVKYILNFDQWLRNSCHLKILLF